MKTVEYDSYAALTASYFITLPRGRLSFARFVRRMRLFAETAYECSNIADLSDTKYAYAANLPNALNSESHNANVILLIPVYIFYLALTYCKLLNRYYA